MSTKSLISSSIHLERQIEYGELTVLQLAECIVNGDAEARNELHDHRVLSRGRRKKGVHLAEYIERLANSSMAKNWCGGDSQVLDEAYNLAIDKFFNFPTGRANCLQQEPSGSDCRYYFKAFMDYAEDQLKAEPPANAIEAEIISTEILFSLVRWHFFLSCLEAKRRAQRLRRRYMWLVEGVRLYLWLPFELPGQRCREWLEANIPDVDPHRPGERHRIQAIVDRLLAKRTIFYLSELDKIGEKLPPSPNVIPSIIQEEISVKGIAQTVAGEKAENIALQRPAIRQLGENTLKQLIRTVFTQLAYGDYVEKDIAQRFGLSAATFSRFAGAHWREHHDENVPSVPPDLWRNTAKVLSGHPDFAIAAQKAGVWKQVCAVLQVNAKTRRI